MISFFWKIITFLDYHSLGIAAFGTLLGGFGALIAAIFGISWFDTSKKKMKGELAIDIARDYLKSVLKIRDKIEQIRNPFIPVNETINALEKSGFSSSESQNEEIKRRAVYSLRWEGLQKEWSIFEEILAEAEVSWGREAIIAQKGLDNLVRELRAVIMLFVNYPDSFEKKYEENEKILYRATDDEFSKKINEEIEGIKKFLKPYL